MAIELVTGHTGEAHVTADQMGRLQALALGDGFYVLMRGGDAGFACTVTSATTLSIGTGDALMEGRHVTSESATELEIDAGTSGMNRNDLVCIHYAKDAETGVESCELVVVKGAETGGTAADPSVAGSSILDGATERLMPLWRIPVRGVSVGTPVQLYAEFGKVDEKPTTQAGRVGSTSIPANGYRDVAVTFPKRFGSAPKVIVDVYTGGTAATYSKVMAEGYNPTTTGFTLRAFNSHSSAVSCSFTWVAIVA